MTTDLDLVHGSGNVYRDFGYPDADVRQARALLAAQSLRILDDRHLSVQQAAALTGVDQAELSRIRRAKLAGFTIDRLMTIINRLDHHVDFDVTVRARNETEREDTAGFRR
jgi:predicted XRE-type DNA-binding protein